MNVISVYVTFSSQEEAKRICRELLNQKLIACANIFQEHTAIYDWDNKPTEHQETAALLKTNLARFNSLVQEIKKLHSYDEPCVMSWNVDNGSPGFLNWVNTQTK